MILDYKHYISGLLLLLLASCSQQQFMEEPSSRSPYETVEISAGMPQTRMTTEEEDKVLHFLWEKGDLITLATATQQLPYIANNSGASTTFHSAYGSAAQPDDVLKNIEGSVVYARYPYNNKAPINMDSLTTLVASGSPFLYAVDTIKDGKLNLHYHHAMAYLRFHVKHDPFPTDRKLYISVGANLENTYEEELISLGRFDYRTRSIIPIEASIELDVPYISFMDSVSLFSISPVQSSSGITFELHCNSEDDNQEEFYFDKMITKELPEGGLQAGHVYDVYLDYTKDSDTETITSYIGGFVKTCYSDELSYFQSCDGETLIFPTAESIYNIEEYGFKMGQVNAAFIQGGYDQNLNSEAASTKQYKEVNITYAVSLDAKVEIAEPGALNDSVNHQCIRAIDNSNESEINYFSTDLNKPWFYSDKTTLVLPINYSFSGQVLHAFTLIYNPSTSQLGDTSIRLSLRHYSNKDLGTYDSYNFASSYPYAYFYAFDLQNALNKWMDITLTDTLPETVTIEFVSSKTSLDVNDGVTETLVIERKPISDAL